METFLKTALSLLFRFFAIFSTKLSAELAWKFFCKPITQKKPLKKAEQVILKQAKQFFVNYEDYQIAVYQWQNINAESKTVMIAHGWGGNALNFSFIINKLVASGFNIIAYDAPAHGNSSGRYTTLQKNAQALLAIEQQVGPIHSLIGHSFGAISGAYASDLAKNTAQLAYLKTIILIAGPNKLANIFAAFTKSMLLPKRVLEIFYHKVEALTQRKIQSMNTTDFLQDFSGKVLVIHDKNDRIVPFSEAQEVSHAIKAKLYATTGYGHGRILLNDNVAAEIIYTLQNESH